MRNDEHQWGEIYDNLTGVGVLGNVVEDGADLGISKSLFFSFKISHLRNLILNGCLFVVAALYSWYDEYVVMDFTAPYIRTGVTCIAPSPRYFSLLIKIFFLIKSIISVVFIQCYILKFHE